MSSKDWRGKWAILFVLFLLHAKSTANNELCIQTENCQCYNNSDHYEYQCSEIDNYDIVLHIYPNAYIQIDCNDVYYLNAQILPRVNFKDIKKLKINYCPLPENGVKEITDLFGIENLNSLTFEYGIHENSTIPTETFQGLQNVTVLKLRANDLDGFGGNFFRNFPDLVSVELDRNNLKLEEDSLSALSKLRFFSISDNHLDNLPRHLFQNLSNLEKLYVWKNNLKTIEQYTFDGLQNLKLLELAFNRIERIGEGAFDATPNLVNISFSHNSLKHLSRRMFKFNNLLEQVVASGNPGLILDDAVFSDLKLLKIVHLDSSKLSVLPEDLFRNSTSLEQISLRRNEIERIPVDIFKDLSKLKKLHLSHNQIKSLNDDTFSFLVNLEILDLEGNELQEVNDKLLRSLAKLKELNLSFNRIKHIHLDAFVRNKILQKLFLSHNLYVYEDKGIYPVSPFNKCGNLEDIDLSFNEVVDFPEDLMLLVAMKSINISHNNISTLRVNALWKVTMNELSIDLEYNRISRLNFANVEQTAYQQPNLDAYHNTDYSSKIRISQNPIICDCYAIDFVRYIRNELYPGVMTAIYFLYDELTCDSPEIFEGISVKSISPPMLSCPIEDVVGDFRCTDTEQCDCVWRPFDNSIVINCANKNLTSLPKLNHPSRLRYNQTELHLENNHLDEGPSSDEIGYWNISKLYLGDNNISSIKWIPPKLEVLDVHKNRIGNIDNNVLDLMNSTSLRKISLRENPWKCDCRAANLTNYLRQHVHQIDTSHIFCEGSANLLINLNDKDLCPTNPVLLASAAVLIMCLCILSSMAAFYYKFQQEIKVWMYAHNICLFLIEEEELDKDKLYDAFVSYSHHDEDFVIENLISILEGGPKPYKLCLHFRNWIPGEFIAKQVTTSVKDSRRTIVVLSPNFLDSIWGKMEFRTAHTEAMKEGRARVIIVLYGDINMESLDDELKAYLKTNTYIKWGDPWFWDKLKYALPHSRIKGLNSKSQKHANMMKYIDDKFALVDEKEISKSESLTSLPIAKEIVNKIDANHEYKEEVILKNEIA